MSDHADSFAVMLPLTAAEEEANEIKDRIHDALEAFKAAGVHNASELKAQDPARYTDEKLASMHGSAVWLRKRIFDQEIANSRHNDMLRVYERFIADPTVSGPQNIQAVYEAVRGVTEGAGFDSVTREHMGYASDFEFLYFRFTNDEYNAAFGDSSKLESGRFLGVMRSVYITADADTRAFLDENLVETARFCREENIRDTEAVRSHVARLVLAKQSDIAPSLVSGTL